jgi:alanine dehydrogenase
VAPAEVVILGGGVVGTNAAKIAVGAGARVTIIDRNLRRLRELDDLFQGRLVTLASNVWTVGEAVSRADLVIGGVLVPGASAPRLVTLDMVRRMKRRSVIVDVAIDQGGCVETARPTTFSEPVYWVDGVLHYCVSNMPAAVPHTSTFALTNATFPYVQLLAELGLDRAVAASRALREGVNTYRGELVHPGVAESQGLECRELALA